MAMNYQSFDEVPSNNLMMMKARGKFRKNMDLLISVIHNNATCIDFNF